MDIDIMNELNAESDATLLLFGVVVLTVAPVVDTPATVSAADTIWNNNGITNEQNRVEDTISNVINECDLVICVWIISCNKS